MKALIFIIGTFLCNLQQIHTGTIADYTGVEEFIKEGLSDLINDQKKSTYNEVFTITKYAIAYLSSATSSSTSCERKAKIAQLMKLAQKNRQNKVFSHRLFGIIFAEVWKTLNDEGPRCGGEENFVANLKKWFADREKGVTPASRKRRMVDEWLDGVFDYLYALDGQTTLIFTIDTSGSMGDDIIKARQIVEQILTMKRERPVNYILSGFNDPISTMGPLQDRTKDQIDLFRNDIAKLRPSGGGDCKELAFEGMMRALDYYPDPDSSMFVFTDAPPKDSAKFEDVRDAANALNVRISFFVNENRCEKGDAEYDQYDNLALDTDGWVFNVPRSKRKRSVEDTTRSRAEFVTASLKATAQIDEASGTHSASTNKVITFPVDDQISFLVVNVETEKNIGSVSLSNPAGIKRSGIVLGKVVLYQAENPPTGQWSISIPPGAGKYRYKVTAKLKRPIAFVPKYFAVERRDYKAISDPKKGSSTRVMLSLTGIKDLINAKSLKASLVGIDGSVKSRIHLLRYRKTNMYITNIYPRTSEDCKIKLTGKTVAGKDFTRLSSEIVRSKAISFHVNRAGDDNTVELGKPARIILIGYTEAKKVVSVSGTFTALAGKGSISKGASFTKTSRGRLFIFATYQAPTDEKNRGLTDLISVKVTVKGEKVVYQIPMFIY